MTVSCDMGTSAECSRYGVLLLNMGGPASLDEVEEYIFNLLADPDMVRVPLGWLLQKPFARMVARRRAPKVRDRYQLIGGSSPIGPATARQAKLVAEEAGLPVACAMRYTPPSAADGISELENAGCNRLVVIPLYPQYSTVSTLSSIKDFKNQATGRDYRLIDRHSENPEYLATMSELLRVALAEADGSLNTHVLFVAHSIPEAYIQQGDPYADEIERTAASVIAGIKDPPPHSLAYQSRVGPVKWRGPALEEALLIILQSGVQQVVVPPLSFVSENLETLYDLDTVFKEQCREAGIVSFIRVPALNDSAGYISALSGMAQAAIESWEAPRA